MAVNYPSMFDVRADMDRQIVDDAYKAGQLPLGGGMMYASSMAGDMYGQGLQQLSGMLGGTPDPRIAKQQALEEIQQQFPNPESYEDFMDLANALRGAGFYDYAEQAMGWAKDLKPTATSKGYNTGTDIGDYEYWKKTKPGWTDEEIFEHMRYLSSGDPNVKVDAENIGARQVKFAEWGDTAREDIRQIREMNRILDKGVYTGWGGDFATQAGKFFGQDVADKELFASLSVDRVLAYTSQTKGAISDREMSLFEGAATSLSKSVDGNRLLLKYSELFSQNVLKLKAHMMNWRTKNPKATFAEYSIEEERWRNDPENELGIATDPDFAKLASEGAGTQVDQDFVKNKQKLLDIGK